MSSRWIENRTRIPSCPSIGPHCFPRWLRKDPFEQAPEGVACRVESESESESEMGMQLSVEREGRSRLVRYQGFQKLGESRQGQRLKGPEKIACVREDTDGSFENKE